MPLLFVGETGVQQEKEGLVWNTWSVSNQFTVTSELQWSLQRNSFYWKRKRGNYALAIKALCATGHEDRQLLVVVTWLVFSVYGSKQKPQRNANWPCPPLYSWGTGVLLKLLYKIAGFLVSQMVAKEKGSITPPSIGNTENRKVNFGRNMKHRHRHFYRKEQKIKKAWPKRLRPLNGSEARGDLAWIQTCVLLSCKWTYLALEQLDFSQWRR